MGQHRLLASFKLQVSFAKEPYKRDNILQKRPIIWRSPLIVATPYAPRALFQGMWGFSFAKEPYKRDCILQKRPIIGLLSHAHYYKVRGVSAWGTWWLVKASLGLQIAVDRGGPKKRAVHDLANSTHKTFWFGLVVVERTFVEESALAHKTRLCVWHDVCVCDMTYGRERVKVCGL